MKPPRHPRRGTRRRSLRPLAANQAGGVPTGLDDTVFAAQSFVPDGGFGEIVHLRQIGIHFKAHG